MKKLILASLIVCISLVINAQKDETLFSNTGLRLTGAWGGSSISMSKYGDDYAVFRGGFGGLEFNKSFFVGFGGYDTNEALSVNEAGSFDMDYKGLMLGFSSKSYRAVHPQGMLLVGLGNLNVRSEGTDDIVVIQPSAGVEFNVFRWFRVQTNLGYRFVTETDFAALSDADASALYGEIKLKFGFSWGD